MAAFLKLPIKGCLPKSRATHSPRDVVIPGLFLSCGTEVAPRLTAAGTRNMPLLTASPAAPATVWPSAVCHYVAKAKAAESLDCGAQFVRVDVLLKFAQNRSVDRSLRCGRIWLPSSATSLLFDGLTSFIFCTIKPVIRYSKESM